MKRKFKALAAACLAVSLLISGCSGQTGQQPETLEADNKNETGKEEKSDISWPEKSIQLVIPTGAGGDTDLCARLFSSYLEKELGQTIVCNNITGGGGVVGSREVKDSEADGYTALFFQYASLLQMISGTADFSYLDDFEIAGIACYDKCYMWIGNGTYPTITDLVEAAKENPGTINIGLSGTGNMSHYVAGLLEKQSGAKFNLIDLGSATECQAALLSGQIDGYANYYSTSYSLLESGDFIAMGVYADEEHELLPGVPTMKEMGYDCSFLNDKYYYFAFPKGTPKEIVERFATAMEKVCADPVVQDDFWERYYVKVEYMGPEDATEYMKSLYIQYEENKDVFDIS